MEKQSTISIIIPAYKQETNIRQDIENIDCILTDLGINHEIIVVVDGFVDNTFEVASQCIRPHIHVLGYSDNKGKGYAVRFGFALAKSSIVGFIDAGLEIDPICINMALELMQWHQADIVVGSKRHADSRVYYPAIRRLYSWGYQLLIRRLFGIYVRDTQVGLKLYRREVIEKILPSMTVNGFAFDIEMLATAAQAGFVKMIESPVYLSHRFESSIRAQSIFKILQDTLKVWFELTFKLQK